MYFGRKDNFWEMAETGPCGPCSEIHLDRGLAYCDKQGMPGHVCRVNHDCARFLELWNLVFIQYNRLGPSTLEPLPARHVDTGMGLERIVSVLQDTSSNYKTDLLFPLIQVLQSLTGDNDEQVERNFTPYRVVADHTRACAFMIGDGVVPGNIGRNYVCRMIIRRAARFGSKLGLNEPFLAKVAEKVIEIYGDFYPELIHNRATILTNLTREEERFQRTVESGVAKLENLLLKIEADHERVLPGEQAFDLYATYGLPFEITRDIAREHNLEVDEAGFREAMEKHRQASGGDAFGQLGGEDVDIFRELFKTLVEQHQLSPEGVRYDPYNWLEVQAPLVGLVSDCQAVQSAGPGDKVEVLLPETGFYVESGGQVSDTGAILSADGKSWEIRVTDMRRPAAGIIVHLGEVLRGQPKVGDLAIGRVDALRRQDIMRNHTATHLLHTALHNVLGEHARQAGSLVAPDHLRFDFNHPAAVTADELEKIEADVNSFVLGGYALNIDFKPLQQAIKEGATALFGEKYGEIVRNIRIGEPQIFSNELCGGTHVDQTSDIGLFLITSEGSTAAGIRRIEAVTGRGAYQLAQQRLKALKQSASLLDTHPEDVPARTSQVLGELEAARKQLAELKLLQTKQDFKPKLANAEDIGDFKFLATIIDNADANILRSLTDQFNLEYASGVAVLATGTSSGLSILVASVTEDLVNRGIDARELIKYVGSFLGGGGGGRPTLAQAGGKDASKNPEALIEARNWVKKKSL
jgi:alanyl-tRNA synthetase